MRQHFLALAGCVLLFQPLHAQPKDSTQFDQQISKADQICPILESAAHANGLPIDFFTRLIWRESHFRPDVLGPITASGMRAEGIAQFMPPTATEHQLSKPFDPTKALPKSSEFLAELRAEFGNLGLAAAAYNAGPQRVRDYLARGKNLPLETRSYVFAITGRSVDDWAAQGAVEEKLEIDPEPNAKAPPNTSCHDLVAELDRTPQAHFLSELHTGFSYHSAAERQSRAVPSWCQGLHQPNTSVCGNVHFRGTAMVSSHLHLRRITAKAARS